MENRAYAATYHLDAGLDPLSGALELISGFHSVFALREEEIDILFDLMLIRVVVRIIIARLRAEFFPPNTEYILRNTDIAVSQFGTLASMNRLAAVDAVRNACR